MRLLLLVTLVATLAGCDSEPLGEPPPPWYDQPFRSVVIEPGTLSLLPTQTGPLSVTVRYEATLRPLGYAVGFGHLPAGLTVVGGDSLFADAEIRTLGDTIMLSDTVLVVVAADAPPDTITLRVAGDFHDPWDSSRLEASGGALLRIDPYFLRPDELCSDYSPFAMAAFEDPTVRDQVAFNLQISGSNPLPCGRVSQAIILDALGAFSILGVQNMLSLQIASLRRGSIRDLGPLEGLAALWNLDLRDNDISDVSALTGLPELSRALFDSNTIADATPFTTMPKLRKLWLNGNPISDLTPLGQIVELTALHLAGTNTTDIGALASLTQLDTLVLGSNDIVDISALEGLTFLTLVDLHANGSLADIQPLLDNAGLGVGDEVWLDSTDVSCSGVDALRAKGVAVRAPVCR